MLARLSSMLPTWTPSPYEIRRIPLPPVYSDGLMESNPKSTTFTRTQFLKGDVPKEQVITEYLQHEIQHRGKALAFDFKGFNEVTQLKMAPNASFDSSVSVLDIALFALTEGRHRRIDFRQPGNEEDAIQMPSDHPSFNMATVIKAMELLGFPDEKRDFPRAMKTAVDKVNVLQEIRDRRV
jgi:hypothetical protein